MTEIERRQSVRRPLKQPCSFTANNQKYNGTTENISLNGVYLKSITPKISSEWIHQTILLQIQLGEKPFTTSARIVYMSDNSLPFLKGIGIEFIQTTKDMRRRLQNFLLKTPDNPEGLS